MNRLPCLNLFDLPHVVLAESGHGRAFRFPAVIFINVIRARFSYECRFGSFYYVHVTREKLSKQCSYEKFAHIMLMKLTPGQNLVLPLIEPFPQLVQLGLISNPLFFILPITSRDLKKRTSLIKSEWRCIKFESKHCMYRFPSLFAVLS